MLCNESHAPLLNNTASTQNAALKNQKTLSGSLIYIESFLKAKLKI